MLGPSSSGSAEMKPTESTPAIAASRSSMSLCIRSTRSKLGSTVRGIEMRTVCRLAGSVKPGSTSRSAWYVQIMSPDATNNTSAIATCATTSVCARDAARA